MNGVRRSFVADALVKIADERKVLDERRGRSQSRPDPSYARRVLGFAHEAVPAASLLEVVGTAPRMRVEKKDALWFPLERARQLDDQNVLHYVREIASVILMTVVHRACLPRKP